MGAGLAILGPRGEVVSRVQPRRPHLRARYESAQTTTDNARHWGAVDALSADAANSASVRSTLRKRARYEAANDSYCAGMVRTLANDCVGIGPTLQMQTEDTGLNAWFNREFAVWAKTVNLPCKLRVLRKARCVDGEAFALLRTNPRLRTRVKLDLELVECDRITTPALDALKPNVVDGMLLDDFGDPIEYHMLEGHPGGTAISDAMKYKKVPAEYVIHWFLAERSEQHRGVPEITASLGRFADHRRFRQATIAAAETAADFAAVAESEMPPGEETYDSSAEFDTIELDKRLMTVLPAGYKLNQVKSEHPPTTYSDFHRVNVAESGRPILMPACVALGDSSGYNYASGRLDFQVYDRGIEVDRSEIEDHILDDRVLVMWVAEALLIPGYVPEAGRALLMEQMADAPHRWFWRGRKHVDPAKEATARDTNLRNHSTTLPREYAEAGEDWRANVLQSIDAEEFIFKERQRRGLPIPKDQGPTAMTPAPADEEEADGASGK